jgi:FAD/FMN-containing dehydrogenase
MRCSWNKKRSFRKEGRIKMKLIKNKIVYEKNINSIEGKALAFAIPDSVEEIQKIVHSSPQITIRGSGTSFTGGCIPHKSQVIDLSKLNKIIDINPSKKTVYLEAGVTLNDLNQALESYGLEFPIETIFSGIETMGGMIAKNSSGSREIKYNRMANWIDSLEVIDTKGELLKISKSEVSDFIGMEGITGVIVRATLRVTTKKTRTISILKSNTVQDIFKANSRLRLNQDISSIELLNKDISYLLGLERKYHLFIEYETEEGMFKKADYLKFSKLKNLAYKKIAGEGFYLLESVKIFQDSIEDFLIYLDQNNIQYFSHFASGVIYLCFKPEDKEKRLSALKFVRKLNGKVSHNSGFGLINREFLEFGEREIIKRIKNRRDPDFKFNRGVLLEFINFDKHPTTNEKQETLEQVKEEQEETNQEASEEPEKEKKVIDTDEKIIETFNIHTQKLKTELSDEEKEKVKKIAAGFFGGGKTDNE